MRAPVARRTPPELATLLSAVAVALLSVIIIATLYFGREIFVPISLAILLSFVLAPVVALLQRIRIPRGLAVVSAVILAFGLIFATGSLLAAQLAQLAGDLPRYQTTITEKVQSLRETTAGRGTLERASGMLKELSKELDRPKDGAPPAPSSLTPRDSSVAKPVPVEVRQPDPGALQALQSLISPLLHPLATTGIIVIFVIFILLQREDLRNRLIRLAGSHDLQRTTAALDDAARRLSRLFLFQLMLNGLFGVAIGTGLWLIGIPSASLWGILAAVLRFVPYIGAFIAAAFPLALAVAVDPGWTMLMWTLALFLVVEPVVGHVIEPLVYGHSTGLSPVAVVASATFWTALWGPIGLVLATPLTVCLVVLGRHVERLEFLDVMFGDRPALSPPEIFYQRMLAGDPTEASDKAEEFLKERPLASYYDEVALKGLQLAQSDAARGVLSEERQNKIRDSVKELVENLEDGGDRAALIVELAKDPETSAAVESIPEDSPPRDVPILKPEELPAGWTGANPVLVVAGRSSIDEAAAIIVGQLTSFHGLTTRTEGAGALATTNLFRLDTSGVSIVCLVFMDADSTSHMRFAVRRVRRKFPNVMIVLACLTPNVEPDAIAALRENTKADVIVQTIADVTKVCIEAPFHPTQPGAATSATDRPTAA